MNRPLIFAPCRSRRACEYCTGARIGADGESECCKCECHARAGSQVKLFGADRVIRVQPELFEVTK